MIVRIEVEVKGIGGITQGEFKGLGEKKDQQLEPCETPPWKGEQRTPRSRVLSGRRTTVSCIQKAKAGVSRRK